MNKAGCPGKGTLVAKEAREICSLFLSKEGIPERGDTISVYKTDPEDSL